MLATMNTSQFNWNDLPTKKDMAELLDQHLQEQEVNLLSKITTIVDDKVNTLAISTAKGFVEVGERFKEVNERFLEIDLRFDAIDKKFESIDSKFISIDAKFEEVITRVDLLEDRLTTRMDDAYQIDRRVSTIESYLGIKSKGKKWLF